MKEKLQQIKDRFNREIGGLADLASLENMVTKYLGRKAGALNAILRGLKDLSEAERKEVGGLANELRKEMEEKISGARSALKGQGSAAGALDVSLHGAAVPEGHLHLMTQAMAEIIDVFERLGFQRRRYSEVEWDYYAFESLNMPPEHPARDEWETFFVEGRGATEREQGVVWTDKRYGKMVLTP